MGVVEGALIASALASAGSSAYGAHKAGKAQKANLNSIGGLFGADQQILGETGLLAQGFGDQQAFAQQAIYDPAYGLAGGFGDIAKFGQTAREDVMRREEESRASLVRRNQQSGLFSSSEMENAFRGLSHDTSRSLRQIEESVARLRLGHRGNMAGAIAGLGDISAQQGVASANYASQYASILGGQQYTSSPVDLGGLGGFAALLAQQYGGGGGGSSFAPSVNYASGGTGGAPSGWWDSI